MSDTPERVVLDASAVIAWVLNEHGAAVVERLFDIGIIPSVNMTEALYRSKERGYRGSEADLMADLVDLGLVIEPVTEADCVRAAELIGLSRAGGQQGVGGQRQGLSLGDGVCLAVAERLQFPVTGSDRHWETLEGLRVTYAPFR
jgi:ribonuclease VapC